MFKIIKKTNIKTEECCILIAYKKQEWQIVARYARLNPSCNHPWAYKTGKLKKVGNVLYKLLSPPPFPQYFLICLGSVTVSVQKVAQQIFLYFWVLPVLSSGSAVSCPSTLSQKTQKIPCRLNMGPPR